jgi:uncharacterized protein
MQIFISGGTGFVGLHLSEHLLAKGHHITTVGTSKRHPFKGRDRFSFISDDTIYKGAWQGAVKDADVVINLAGRNIFRYWTKKYKSLMYDSRIRTTRNIADALSEDRKIIFLSTSAAGYYGSRGEEMLNENSSPGDDFLSTLCQDWEKEALRAEEKDARVVLMRFGVVLGKNGGALSKMLPAFRYFVGGPIGNGMQWFPWIHVTDLISAIDFLIEKQHVKGPVNFCAPTSVRQKDFAKAIGKALHRPSFFRVPAFVLRLFMGELGSSLLESQRVAPGILENEGYSFHFHGIQEALQDILN